MTCIQVRKSISNIHNKCLETLGLKTKPKPNIKISLPFNFQPGPLVNFPGYSEDDISLMREKAIASTAVVEDGGDFEFEIGLGLQRPKSRASSHSCGLGGKAARSTRRYSLRRSPASAVY